MIKSSFKNLSELAAGQGATLNLAQAVQLAAPTISPAPAPVEAVSAAPATFEVADSLFAVVPAASDTPVTAATAPDNHQPYLVINQFIAMGGVFPPRPAIFDPGSAPDDTVAYFGSIRMFAGTFTPGGTREANGQLLNISGNTALFSLYGTTYGGDGKSTFALPDLGGHASGGWGQGPGLSDRYLGETYGSEIVNITQSNLTPASGGSYTPVDITQPTLSLNWIISVEGIFPFQNGIMNNNMEMIGLVSQFGGNFAPVGTLPCDGRLLAISDYEALFQLIGTTYGGDGETTFALPDLRGRTVSGAATYQPVGTVIGSETTMITQNQMPTDMGGNGFAIPNGQPSLALNYIIALQGIFPSGEGDGGGADASEPFLGEIVVTAVDFAPKGWAICAGQLLPINQNQALFALLGTTYGGNGTTNFALPDLRYRTAVGVGDGYVEGQTGGSGTFTLNASDMPALNIVGDGNNNALYGGHDDDVIQGNGGNDTLTGNNGHDRLDGGTGSDSLTGGNGDDTYVVDNSGDSVVELAAGGTDTVEALLSRVLGDNIENLTLVGSNNINGTGNNLNNVLRGNSGNNILIGGIGNDTYYIQNPNDSIIEDAGEGTDLIVSSVTYSLFGTQMENLTLSGSANLNATGNGLANILTGNSGNNRLDGGSNNDTMAGGVGNDTYVVNGTGDVINEFGDEGTDLVESTVSYTLGGYVENLTLTGSNNINGTGNGLGNVLTGNTGNNTLTGGAGDDTYYVDSASDLVVELGGEGIDIIYSSANRGLLGTFVENLTLTGSANVVGTGNSLSNRIVGNSGNNVLTGNGGNDTYVVQNTGDTVNEGAGEGTDSVESSATFTLGANVEILTLTGLAAINGTGNDLGNILTGNGATNVLSGGLGNDTYYVQNAADNVVEASNAGTDLIFSSVTYSLAGRQVENLTLTGLAGLAATGNGLSNILVANAGNNAMDAGAGHDRLDGGAGADSMTGGTGNDTYCVDNAGDIITELTGGGLDVVETSVTFTLAANAENLIVTGNTAIDGTGNDLNNTLTGNSNKNVLSGGLGNDTYYVQNTADDVVELGGAGTDLIFSTVTYSLSGRYAETLSLTGSGNVNATGNSLTNTLNGNAGNNTLNGKGGADILSGGLGADIFFFEPGSGVDTITDFSAAQDDSINIHAYTDGVANAGLVTQNGANVVITLGGANVITVNSALVADVLAHIVW